MDPMRRRLTVAQGPEKDPGGKQGGSDGTEDLVQKWGFAAIFDAARKEEKRAIAVISQTDEVGEKKAPFGIKDQVVLCHPDISTVEKAGLLHWLQAQDGCAVGWTCNKGCKEGVCNQDCLSILMVENDFALYGVYDGHGPKGHVISEFACRVLPKLFFDYLKGDTNPGEALKSAFKSTQMLIEKEYETNGNAEMSGSTCTMAYHCMKRNKLWLAHVGDSRSIIGCNSANGPVCSALTIDHKPDLPKEKQRIESAKPPGRVIFDGFFNHRVFAKDAQLPGLNMSRALGDCFAHRLAGLTAEPDISEFDLTSISEGALFDANGGPAQADASIRTLSSGETVLLVCTDGVWEFIADSQAMDIAVKDGIAELAKSSYKYWMDDSNGEVSDDITGIKVRLQKVR